MPPKPKPKGEPAGAESHTHGISALTEAALTERAAARGYTIEERDGQWYATIGGTSYGPMQSLEELDEFLPKE